MLNGLSQRLLQNSLRTQVFNWISLTLVGHPYDHHLGGLPGHFTSCWLCWLSNVIMLAIKKTDTLGRRYLRYLALVVITGLFWSNGMRTQRCRAKALSPTFLATLQLSFVGIMKSSTQTWWNHLDDLWMHQVHHLWLQLHMNYMMKPNHHGLDKIFWQILPGVDKYDFDAAKLNKKIKFFGDLNSLSVSWYRHRYHQVLQHPVAGVGDADKWELLLKVGWALVWLPVTAWIASHWSVLG